MRRSLFLLPLLIVGCAPGRQAAVSNSGRVASTAEGGTYVAGAGKVGPHAEDVAWSPDGKTLAYSAKNATILWPGGDRIPRLDGKLSWSPDGKTLAGDFAKGVGVWDSATKRVRGTGTLIPMIGIRWMPDGRVLEVDGTGFQVEGIPRVIRETGEATSRTVLDAMPQPDGTVVWLETGPPKTNRTSDSLSVPLLEGRWTPTKGVESIVLIGQWGSLLGTPSPLGLTIPDHLALSPDAKRYAVAGLVVETDAKSLTRLKALADRKGDPTPSERREYWRLSNAARKRSVLALFEPGKASRVLWSETLQSEEGSPTDVEWSPDGQWLAVARKDGTVRIRVGGPR